MGDLMTALPLLKWLGVGAGGTGVAFAVFQFWMYTTVTSNKKKLHANIEKTQEQETTIQIMTQ